jgi:hypothetical protein
MEVVICTDELSKYYSKGGEIKALDKIDLKARANRAELDSGVRVHLSWKKNSEQNLITSRNTRHKTTIQSNVAIT